MGLDPLKVYNSLMSDVINLYVACVINDTKKEKNKDIQWVTSKTANWH